MASTIIDNYFAGQTAGKPFPTGVGFLMPGLGIVPKASPPTLEQVNQACALAFQDSLSRASQLTDGQASFMQLSFAQAFLVGKELYCLAVIQWVAAKVDSKKAGKKPSKGKPAAKSVTRASVKPVPKARAAAKSPSKGKAAPQAKGRPANNGKPARGAKGKPGKRTSK